MGLVLFTIIHIKWGMQMKESLKSNKFFLTALILTIVIGGLTFGNLPGAPASTTVQTVNGQIFNFAEYKAMDHEMLALFNYLDTIVNDEYQGYGEWDGWYADEGFYGLHHYVLAFMAYTVSFLFETTPGYRTEYYQNFLYDLIKKMNTTEADWDEGSIEYREWSNPDYGFLDYYYPDYDDPDDDDLYMGGWRGPANIMWTAHYALMMALYERSFNTGEMKDELSWYVRDWNNSLTTDGFGNDAKATGGIWKTGLVPCEPYIVFVQCNSIPIACTELYDNMYGTQYMEGGMWDYGLDFINTVMQDEYDLFTDGYYTMKPKGFYYESERFPDTFPGPSMSSHVTDKPKVSSYCNGWALAFLQYTQEGNSLNDYPEFLKYYMKSLSGDQAYMMDTYNNPDGFGTFDILGTLFTLHLANQMEDYVTRDRLANFMYDSYNKVWENNGRELHYDTMSLSPFLQSVMAFGWIWAHAPVTIMDVEAARPTGFWDWPYISAADDDNIWIYQAEWDSAKDGFVLNIRVDQEATLTFSNFDSAPTAYSGGAAYATLATSGSDYTLTLAPGTYYLVIM